MRIQFAASNALLKLLGITLPRLPTIAGQPVGVSKLKSDQHKMCWQVHVVKNRTNSFQQTIIACEANSRFICFIPVYGEMSLDELTSRIFKAWYRTLSDMLVTTFLIPAELAHAHVLQIENIHFDVKWVKNTDLSIHGHISDAALWLQDTLEHRCETFLNDELNFELANHINMQTKKVGKKSNKVFTMDEFTRYCKALIELN